MFVTTPTVCNVKISFAVPQLSEAHLELLRDMASKLSQHYYVVRAKYTFTIYRKSKIVNVTGIDSFVNVMDSIHCFRALLDDCSNEFVNVKIDNITAIGRYTRVIDFLKIQKCIPPGYTIKIPSIFPGAFIKLPNEKKILLFRSGKYISVGCKSRTELVTSFKYFKAVLENYNKICPPTDTLSLASSTTDKAVRENSQ